MPLVMNLMRILVWPAIPCGKHKCRLNYKQSVVHGYFESIKYFFVILDYMTENWMRTTVPIPPKTVATTTRHHFPKASIAQTHTHTLHELLLFAIDFFCHAHFFFFVESNFAAVSFGSRGKHAKHASHKLIVIHFLDRGSFFSTLLSISTPYTHDNVLSFSICCSSVRWNSRKYTTSNSFCGHSPTQVHGVFVISVHIRFYFQTYLELNQHGWPLVERKNICLFDGFTNSTFYLEKRAGENSVASSFKVKVLNKFKWEKRIHRNHYQFQ